MLLKQVLPAIDANWPVGWHWKIIFCQQDNALHYLSSDNIKFLASWKRKRLSIYLVNQPTQLPDLNANDLGLLWLIDKDLGELIDAVQQAYNNLTVYTVNNAFVMLMAQMNKILRHGGSEQFFTPKQKKATT